MGNRADSAKRALHIRYTNDLKSGRGDWIRTSDPLRPRQVRYQAALRPDIPNDYAILWTISTIIALRYSPYCPLVPQAARADEGGKPASA